MFIYDQVLGLLVDLRGNKHIVMFELNVDLISNIENVNYSVFLRPTCFPLSSLFSSVLNSCYDKSVDAVLVLLK